MELTLEHVSKQFKDRQNSKTAVDDVSLKFGPGVWGLLGANGSGKTTLMRMICGIMKPTAGRICYDGIPIDQLGDAYRDVIGYLPQEFGFYPEFTVQQYLEYIAALKGLTDQQTRQKIDELLIRLSLEDVRKKRITKLSGGMKRRAGIAQALLNNPRILILDEPTAGLDPNERIRFRNLISGLSEDRIVLLSTHIVSDIEYIANEIWLMHEGILVQKGSLEEIIHSMPEKVWSCFMDHAAAADVMKKYKVSNMKSEAGGVELRIISKSRPFENAVSAEPSLEDVFLYYFGEKGGDGK